MPQISGPELARRLASTRPDVKVGYMTGYADEDTMAAATRGGTFPLQKPFTRDGLLAAVRERLGSDPTDLTSH